MKKNTENLSDTPMEIIPLPPAPFIPPVPPSSLSPLSRKMVLIGVTVFIVLGVGIYSLLSSGGAGVKGNFAEVVAPITTEAPPAPITQEASPVANSLPVAVKTITSSDASVKSGKSTTITIKGSNLSPMILASSGTAITFSNTSIILTISSGAAASFSDLVVSPDGSTATVKATIGDTAVPGSYAMNYFDISVSDKPLGTMQNVLTVE